MFFVELQRVLYVVISGHECLQRIKLIGKLTPFASYRGEILVERAARCAWSSGRTLDFRPLGPGWKPGVFMSGKLSPFVSSPGARSVAHKTLAAKKRR